MNNTTFSIKQNDTLPTLTYAIRTTGNLGEDIAYNLSGTSSVNFNMISECNEMKIYSQSATTHCISGTSGVVVYNWTNGDTDTYGTYYGEFEVLFTNGKKMTIPTNNRIKINIFKNLNNF